MTPHQFNTAMAKALGLPKHTRRAVLTLEAGELPTLEVEMYIIDDRSFPREQLVTQSIPIELEKLQFMLRLEPFRD